MRKGWIVSAILAASFIFYAGYRSAPNQQEAPAASKQEFNPDFQLQNSDLNFRLFSISEKEFKEYQNLKDQKSKYDKANEILAKMVLLFIADMGLQLGPGDSSAQDFFKVKFPVDSDRSVVKTGNEAILNNSKGGAVMPTVTPMPESTAAYDVATTPEGTPISKSKKGKLPSMVNAAQAKGAVFALYQAFLWRAPDGEGGSAAVGNFTSNGWSAYLRNAREMVGSDEFRNRILSAYTPEQLITHAFSVYFGRCPTDTEYRNHLRYVDSGNFQRAAANIITKARDAGTVELFTGGFNPSTCPLRGSQ